MGGRLAYGKEKEETVMYVCIGAQVCAHIYNYTDLMTEAEGSKYSIRSVQYTFPYFLNWRMMETVCVLFGK